MNRIYYIYLLIVGGALFGCTKMGPQITNTKAVVLNPGEYLHKKLYFQGKISKIDEGAIIFEFTDDTGYLNVTTEDQPTRFHCPVESQIQFSGTPKQVNDNNIVIVFNDLIECNNNKTPEAKKS